MADQSISIKPFARKATHSLAERVLFLSVALLGFPLLLHTFFLYHREYEENVSDAFLTMRSLAESRATYMEQMIINQSTILRALSDDLPLSKLEQNDFLKSEKDEYRVDGLLYVSLDEPCSQPVCQDPNFLSYFKQLSSQDSFVGIYPTGQGGQLFVGKSVLKTDQPAGAFLIATPVKSILSYLAYQEYSPYPLRLSILDPANAVILSSDPSFSSLSQYNMEPERNQSNAWFLESPDNDYLAVRIPIEGSPYTLMLDTPEKSIATLQMQDYIFRIASLIFIVCILGGGILMWLTHLMSQPLRSLCEIMKRISQGATHVRYRENRMGFEINVLGSQMNQMIDSLIRHQREAEQERIARERLAEEFRIGHEIQSSMLPTELPSLPSLEVAPGYLSAREVSGDFYDLFILDDGRLMIAIADAADKGISACLFSLSFRSTLRASAAIGKDFSAIVKIANRLLMQDTVASSFFITAWIGIYDPKTNELSYCSQGHPPTYLCSSNNSIQELSTEGIALGVEPIDPKIARVELHAQDLLLLYTDGVIEATNPNGQFFGKERLKDFVVQCQKNHPQIIVEQLIGDIRRFCSTAAQSDDLTLLAIKVKN